jgi:hypothetical protein
LGIVDYKKEYIGKFRNQWRNVKLRHIYFRLISKDIYAMNKCSYIKWSMSVSVRDVGKWNHTCICEEKREKFE